MPVDLFFLLLIALGGVNLWTFAVFGYDKMQARGSSWRVSEAHLLLCAAVGGSPGALLGRRLFRHKTRKQPFVNVLMTIVSVQALGLAGWAGWALAGS